MKDIFREFNAKEKARIRALVLLFAFSLVFLLAFSLRERGAYNRLADQLEAQKKAFVGLDKERAAAVREDGRWQQAEKDLADLKTRYFYQEQGGINALRLDLRQLLGTAGVNSRSLKFDYADIEKEKVRKVTITFSLSGSYPVLRRFLETIEQFPKFLYLERLDFQRIEGGGNSLDLKVTLAGYYEYS